MIQNLSESIKDADLVIVGIGSEWDWVKKGIENDSRYKQILEFCKDENNHWLLPIVEFEYAHFNQNARINQAYENLRKLIGDKRYFVVSDLFLQDAPKFGFDDAKCVYPCGNFKYLQTSMPEDELIPADSCEEFMDIVNSIHSIITTLNGNFGEDISFSHPVEDGKQLYLNQKRSEYRIIKYNESAYLEKWDKYMKFLMGTVNSNLLMLELGVGLEYPTIVRWPFEKVAFINKKAHLIRVHNKLFFHTAEIADRTDSIQMNSIDYIMQESKGL